LQDAHHHDVFVKLKATSDASEPNMTKRTMIEFEILSDLQVNQK